MMVGTLRSHTLHSRVSRSPRLPTIVEGTLHWNTLLSGFSCSSLIPPPPHLHEGGYPALPYVPLSVQLLKIPSYVDDTESPAFWGMLLGPSCAFGLLCLGTSILYFT